MKSFMYSKLFGDRAFLDFLKAAYAGSHRRVSNKRRISRSCLRRYATDLGAAKVAASGASRGGRMRRTK